MRKIVKAAATAAVGTALVFGFTGTASAASGPTNLTGYGCPSQYTNNNSANGGATGWTQYLQYTWTNPATGPWGDYAVYYWSVNGTSTYQGDVSYRCY